ncbi:hypothetical protein CBS63078_7775 [Aspergillus niger]|nr:hypothetical protein CBS115989_8375 [Aspergillus niger]KAI2851185.1 hypothetical protein CBS11232_6096 [Aspergillus niger]KAI2851231.1 hypothetical protein CBS11350_1135 [Aspergillus niger]KAI2880832.1 hypothetical protein CBS115988_1234 [Aspergillus niger]KAI2886204.1 hypothetical protein CBS13152_7211 [Aspergillus niger]
MMAMSHPGQLGWLISDYVYLEQVYYSTHSFVVDKHQGKKACAPAQWPQTARLQDTAAFNLPQGSDSSDVLAVTQCCHSISCGIQHCSQKLNEKL